MKKTRMLNDLLIVTAEVRRKQNIFKLLKENNWQSRVVYSAVISFKNEVN